MRIFLIIIALSVPAFGAWTRVVFDPKGGGKDQPRPQILQYFIDYPSLHDAYDWCYLCTEEQRQSEAQKEQWRSDIRFLGRLNGRAVYDILYYLGDAKEPAWKSLVVQFKNELYGEVLQVHPVSPTDGVRHSMLVRKGGSTMVCARDSCDRSGCINACFRVDSSGPVYVGGIED